MTKDDLDEIAKRETHCKPWGEAVTISRAEKDQLVALARDGMRYRWLTLDCDGDRQDRIIQWLARNVATKDVIDACIDEAKAKEEA